MKNLIFKFCLCAITLFSLSNCEKTETSNVIEDNGTYDIRIDVPTELNDKLVAFGQPFEIKIFFQTFADEKFIRNVQIDVLDQFRNVIDVLFDEDVNAEDSFVFQDIFY